MISWIFPGKAIFKNKPHTAEFFTLTLEEIDKAGESFMGIIKVDEPDASYFLFFLRGDAYAAGYIKDSRPMPLSINDFLKHMSADIKQRTLSLYETDPVLMKGLLVFLQRDPSIRIMADNIDLDGIFARIRNEKASAFMILKKNNMHNFFYFHSGEPEMAHFADEKVLREDSSIVEQMLLYAYPADKTPVEVMVYQDIKTSEAGDKSWIKPFLADVMVREPVKPGTSETPPVEVGEEKPMRVRIEITEGPQKGNKFNVPLPCTIGRRDADIRIRDVTISKRHASIEAQARHIIFRDLNSTNGSVVNDKEVKEVELSDGDVVRMGNSELIIHFVSS